MKYTLLKQMLSYTKVYIYVYKIQNHILHDCELKTES